MASLDESPIDVHQRRRRQRQRRDSKTRDQSQLFEKNEWDRIFSIRYRFPFTHRTLIRIAWVVLRTNIFYNYSGKLSSLFLTSTVSYVKNVFEEEPMSFQAVKHNLLLMHLLLYVYYNGSIPSCNNSH